MDMLGGRRMWGRSKGSEVEAVTIGDGDIKVDVISWGAVIRDVRLTGVDHPLVLGFDDLQSYEDHSPHFGAVAGRYANRIAAGRLQLDGRSIELDRNEDGRNHLHGGAAAFGSRAWQIVDAEPTSVRLRLVSPDGESGYPGTVTVECRYTVVPPGTLRVELTGTTDATTIVNLAQHSYFNLDGTPSILDHRLRIAADHFTPVDDFDIPTGAVDEVEGTRFDFRTLREIGASPTGRRPLDHNFVLAGQRRAEPALAATLEGSDGRVAMDVWTTEPGLQVYDGYKLSVPVPGLDGRRYQTYGGLAMEPQVWPNSPNEPDFPSAVLRPGETYRQTTEFRFRVVG